MDWPFESVWPLNGAYLRASYGRGFRLPSFEERLLRFDHSELGYIVEGNDRLKPETSHGFRAEVGYAPSSDEIATARAFVDALPAPALAARVDLVPHDGRLLLMELEVIEPHLFPQFGPGLGERVAAACEALLARP